MRKFHDVYKEKQTKAAEIFEGRVIGEFKSVYSTLLEKYRISDFYTLNEEEQLTFLAELNSYWTEEEGLSEKGHKFLQIRSDVLSESSTTLQKRNFLKNKAAVIVSETLRQSELKWKIYDIIDEMYSEIQAKGITDVLSPDIISDIIHESLKLSVDGFVKEIRTELNESAKEVDALNEKKDPKADVRNRGDVVFPAKSKSVKDDKDHFPINSVAQARNALARVNQYSSAPSWYKGSLESLVKAVAGAVKRKYPSIKVSKAAEKPGK
jgi:hypothetical protein